MNWLTQNLTVKTKTIAASSITGEMVETWSTGDIITGRIRPLSITERYYRDKLNIDTTHRLYSTTELIVNQRVSYDKDYDVIQSINPMSFGRFYQIDLRITE